jgi:HEAT repeat protein
MYSKLDPTRYPKDSRIITGLLFQEGLSPSRIAHVRGLAESTIQDHLVWLVGEGKAKLSAIVSDDVEHQILSAIQTLGDASRLTPIKEILPESVSYLDIRCVRASHFPQFHQKRRLPHGTCQQSHNKNHSVFAWARVYDLAKQGSPCAVPELIGALQHWNGTVRRFAAFGLGTIRDPRAVAPLLRLLDREPLPQVRKYAIVALRRIGDPRVRSRLEQIAESEVEHGTVTHAAKAALRHL